MSSSGVIIGRVGSTPFVWPLNSDPYNPGRPDGVSGTSFIGSAINDNGYLTERVGPVGAGDYHMYAFDGFQWSYMPYYTFWGYTWCNNLNNSNLGVGFSFIGDGTYKMPILWDLENHAFDRTFPWVYGSCEDVNEFDEVVGADTWSSLGVVFDGYKSGYLHDLLVAPLPQSWSRITACYSVNNRHTIVGQALKTNGHYVGFRADPVEGIQVTVDLGQLGSNPSYIGALPPAFTVDFTDEQGNRYTGSRRTYTYDSLTGHAQIIVPPEVTGPFRAYFRLTNAADNPTYGAGDWQGPGYLGRVCPPMNEPALPIDSSYIPPVSLFLGDSDSDNEITIGDYSIVSRAFGTFIGDPDWDARADIDGDEEISQGDLDKIIENFGLVGD